ncbi:hypothetical protein C3K47_13740 [Solitalea longa]|uniref:Porin n=1 Tax=Solitalea longa TaxID=2079460 RepID=A0A2S5A0G4_9SPHI|nr:hypothetical protein [Solitalea longa]POY35809.1 hypothetical protein C3K47_13740 [Solitalea longa]
MKKILLLLTVLAITTDAALAQFSNKIQSMRPYDQTGINVFETGKADSTPYDGLQLKLGAGFTQQFQSLKHENPTATLNGYGQSNYLYPISPGFMTAQANLFIDAQLYDGMRLNVTTYLSSRHHNETWVKGGFLQIDKLPFKGEIWDKLMSITTIKAGHYEVNYGDMHFRRSDGGHTLQNPFMEGLILDAFATEIGGDVLVQKNGFFGMIGLTGGAIKGNVDSVKSTTANPDAKKAPSIIFKAGFDRQMTAQLRVRVSGSWYNNSNAGNNTLTLYGGDRTGSNYQNAMEKYYTTVTPTPVTSAGTAIAFSGRVNPGFSQQVNSFMLNAFLKYSGFEFFGTYESAKGRGPSESTDRSFDQYAIEGVYRFGPKECVYVGARYNAASGRLAGTTFTDDVKINRFAAAAGWFITKNILMKAEYVEQKYEDFPTADYRSGGKFNGIVIEAAVSF